MIYSFTHTDEVIKFVSEQLPNRKYKDHLLTFEYIEGNQKKGKFVEIKPKELQRLTSFNCLKKVA